MTHIRNEQTLGQRRRVGSTLMLAAATGGLLAAAMAGSPTARADNPITDIYNDVQGSITAGDTDEGLIATSASSDLAEAQNFFSLGTSALTSGESYLATAYFLLGGYKSSCHRSPTPVLDLFTLGI